MTPGNEKWSRSLFPGRPILLRPFLLAFFALCFSLHGHPSFLPFDFNFVAIFFPLTFFSEWFLSVIRNEAKNKTKIHEDSSDQTTAFSSLSFPFLSFLSSLPFLSLSFSFSFSFSVSFPFPLTFPFLFPDQVPFLSAFLSPFFFFPVLFLFLCFPISFPFSFPFLSFSFSYRPFPFWKRSR